MELTGTVLNVVDFGCFIDIGMHDSGLVHVSRLADKYKVGIHMHTSESAGYADLIEKAFGHRVMRLQSGESAWFVPE